jgi:hypothetical protein
MYALRLVIVEGEAVLFTRKLGAGARMQRHWILDFKKL